MSDGKKKFTIKSFRPHTNMDRTQAQEVWEKLSRAIDEIHQRNASQLSFEELYRHAYNLVLHKHGQVLYEGVTDKITSHFIQLSLKLQRTTDSFLLTQLVKCWSEERMNMIMIRDILMYMDRTYVTAQRKRPVYELGLHLFRITVWEHESVHSRITSLLLDCIAKERESTLTNNSAQDVKQILDMLLELGHADGSNVYERDFEQLFLGTTQEFYRCESLQYLSQNSAADYVRKAEVRLEEEKLRASKCLSKSTEGPLLRIIETELIERHAQALVDMENCGFAALLVHPSEQSQMEILLGLFNLFSRVPSTVDLLRDALSDIVKKEGNKLVQDQERASSDPAAFVRGVLTVRDKYKKVVEIAFRAEKRAEKRLKEAFEDFLNNDARAASCLAVYVDELLRSGLRGATETEVNAYLQNVIVIFRYLSDKDVFEAFYKQHLAKRLLGGKSISDEAERAMVSLLKAECGYQFTSKLEGMFNDMRISRDTRDTYKHFKNTAAEKDSFELEVDVLTTGYWPSQPVPPCTLPNVVNLAIDRFSTFYLQKHTGRKLSWQTNTGTAELRAAFHSKKHELLVSTYQMCILMLFNHSDSLTLAQIRSQTNIPDMELRRHLISLCTPKHRILKKASRGKTIASDSDSFTFHKDYTSKLKRVKIPLVSMKETQFDGNNSNQASAQSSNSASNIPAPVEEDRRHLVEAAIVRIMKARKTLDHNFLVAEVTRQLSVRFTPTPQFIKKRIESLMDREYLERDSMDRRLYVYMA